MKHYSKLLIILTCVAMILSGCSVPPPEEPVADSNVEPVSQEKPPLRVQENPDLDKFPGPDEILTQLLTAEQSQDFEQAYSLYWRESLNVFDYSLADVYPSESYNPQNFELVSYEATLYANVQNRFDRNAQLFQVRSDYYWYGEHREDTFYYLMVFVPEEGWKVSWKHYLGTDDLDFKESRVMFYKDEELTMDTVVSKAVKFAPRQLIQTGYTTYLKLDILANIDGNGFPYLLTSSQKSPRQDTIMVFDDGQAYYEVILDSSEIKTNYQKNIEMFNTSMFVDCGQQMDLNYDTLNITVEDYVMKLDYNFRTYDMEIMRDGEFLNLQTSIMTRDLLYNEEVFIPEVSDEFYNGNLETVSEVVNTYKWNTTGNRINHSHLAVRGDWAYMWFDYALWKENLTDGQRVQVNGDNANYPSIYGDWLYYLNGNDQLSLYRMNLNTEESVKLTKGRPFESFQIIGDKFYYETEYNIGRVDIDFDAQFEPLVSGEIGNWSVHGDDLYYIKHHDDRVDNDQIIRMNMETREKTVIYEEIYNSWPHIDELYNLLVDDQYVFFLGELHNGTIYRMNHDGTGLIEFLEWDDDIPRMSMEGDWLYFSDDGYNLIKIKKDGSDMITMLSKTKFYRMAIVDDKLFYRDHDENLYFMQK